MGESAGMEIDRRSSSVVIAVLLALALAVPALASTGGGLPSTASKAPSAKGGDSGGTPTSRPPAVRPSGGVAGPAVDKGARVAQDPDDQPPQVEQPTETTPTQPTPTETAPTVTPPEQNAEQAPGEGGGQAPSPCSGGLGLPSTGLQLGGLAAVGAALVLGGWALLRRPAKPRA